MKGIRIAASVMIIVASGWLIECASVKPWQQNRVMKLVAWHQFERGEIHSVRRDVELLEAARTGDPYLSGMSDLLIARGRRTLGDSAAAQLSYEAAIEGGIIPDVIVELGLYELELGLLDSSMRRFRRAAMYSPRLVYRLPDIGIMNEVLEEVRMSDGEICAKQQN